MAEIKRIADNVTDHRVRPLVFVLWIFKAFPIAFFSPLMEPPRWTGNLFLPKQRNDFIRPHARVGVLKYPPYDPCRFLVHQQLVVIVRGLTVADGIKRGTVQPCLCPCPYGRTYLAGLVPAGA